MSRVLMLLCATLLAATFASAQSMPAVRPIKMQPVQPAPTTQVAPAPTEAVQAQPFGPVQTVEGLTAANQKLRAENKALRTENGSLKAKLAALTTPGGSQVRAYCPAATISRNTAGAEADCAATGYKCEDVSGLCHKTCSSSEQCALGYSCNPCNSKCENNAGPATQC